MSEIDDSAATTAKQPLDLSHPEVRRLGKYGLVGISSLIVGWVSVNTIYFTTHPHRLLLATAIGYALSVANGFIWNRKWTFKEKRGESIWAQSSKFVVVNLAGYAINIVVLALLLAAYLHATHRTARSVTSIGESIALGHGGQHFTFLVLNAAGLIATVIVTIWNFACNRAWSFKH